MSSFICVGKKLRKAHNKGVIKYKNGNSLTRQIVVFSKPIAKQHKSATFSTESRYDQALKFVKNFPNTTFINATEGGLGFSGIPNEKLIDVKKEHLTKQIDISK